MDNTGRARAAARHSSMLKQWVGADAGTKAGLERVLRLARSLVIDVLVLSVGLVAQAAALIGLLCHSGAGASEWAIRAGIGTGSVASLAGAVRLYRGLRRIGSRPGRRAGTRR
ncbi:hypothetical protein ACFY00_38035 [Kitasatospora sp. NPDC001540]|uniref:hypothetical protein n=1 Tax=Kitasatospora sp. NPDC001540 TaxID=3364014 RepID=UPI003676B2A0